jgi:hypothetical protein
LQDILKVKEDAMDFLNNEGLTDAEQVYLLVAVLKGGED